MIGRDELVAKSDELALSVANVQRDYVFSWLIAGLFQPSRLSDILTLKGGNALRKGYFPGTRFSDDLDLTTESGLDSDRLIEDLNEVCRFAQARTGIEFDLARNRIVGEQLIDGQKKAYKVSLYFKDFSGQPEHISLKVRLDVAEYDRLYLPTQTRQLIHPYSDASECATAIRCVKLEEALADKMKCLLQRRYCYDLFDLVYGTFIAQDIAVDRQEMMKVFLQKTIFQDSPIAAKGLLSKLPLELFKGFWGKVVCPASSRMTFERAVELLSTGLEALFAPFGGGGQVVAAFYPAELRNPILQAGAERRMVSLTYHGATRLVEPYSLAFKRRKSDGVAQEYFYGYDRTGGAKGPGIKAFLNYDVERLELTNEHFEPRFSVELSKAGDLSQSGYFSGVSGVRRGSIRTARRRSARVISVPYVIQCSYCGKRFSRQKVSLRLNAHKDRYGNNCFGRSGYRVR